MRLALYIPTDKKPQDADSASEITRWCQLCGDRDGPVTPRTDWESKIVRNLRCVVVCHPNGMPGFQESDWVLVSVLLAEKAFMPQIALQKIQEKLEQNRAFSCYRGAFDLLCLMLSGCEVVLFSGGGPAGIVNWKYIHALWDVCALRENVNYYRVAESSLVASFRWADLVAGRIRRLAVQLPVSEMLQPLLPLDLLAQGITCGCGQGRDIADLEPLVDAGSRDGVGEFWFRPAWESAGVTSGSFLPFSPGAEAHLDRFRLASVGHFAETFVRAMRIYLPELSLVAAEELSFVAVPSDYESSGALRLLWEIVLAKGDDAQLASKSERLAAAARNAVGHMATLCRLAHSEYLLLCDFLIRADHVVEDLQEFNVRRSRLSHNDLRPRFLVHFTSRLDLISEAPSEDDSAVEERVRLLAERLESQDEMNVGAEGACKLWPQLEAEILSLLDEARQLPYGSPSELFPDKGVIDLWIVDIRTLVACESDWAKLEPSSKAKKARAFWRSCLALANLLSQLNPSNPETIGKFYQG